LTKHELFIPLFPPSGVAFVHLLFEGSEKLVEVSTEYPALGFALAIVGTLLVLAFEQVAVMLISRMDVGNNQMMPKISEKMDPENPQKLEVVQAEQHDHDHQSSCDHTHAVDLIAGADSYSVLVKAYMVWA
jgi:ABC-type nickel/cobalt efflux system permease component RcnA